MHPATSPSSPLHIAEPVAQALREGRPVVALESTIISHGMPWPDNLEMARRVEHTVREAGATPATIAVIGGRWCVGLADDALEHLARQGPATPKLSRRDLPLVTARGADGATTVAATMIIAARAGIRVFATGGIGGVHRGAAHSMDISADLMELARSPVAVVCAGAKAILDLGLTLEVLETQGVPVYGWCTDELPAFYSRRSGLRLPSRVDSLDELALALQLQWATGLGGGALVANPIPAAAEIPHETIGSVIDDALVQAVQQGIHGAAVTPYLLSRLNELTAGRSLAANIELVLNNARLAAGLAVQWARLQASLAMVPVASASK
jgi:pseudouridine-5'-phosphate glycosidase